MLQVIKASVVGFALSLTALMPFWLQTDDCDMYAQAYARANLPDPSNPYEVAACHASGPDFLDFATLFYLIGMLGLGLVLAARIAQRYQVGLAAAIGGTSVIIAATSGILFSGLPLSLLAGDAFFVLSVAAAVLFGAIIGSIERRRFIVWHRSTQ